MYISRVKGTSQTDSSSQVFQTALSLSSLWMDGWIHYRVLELSVVWRVEDLWRQIDAPPTTDRQLIQTEEAAKRLEHSKENELKICPPFLVCILFSPEILMLRMTIVVRINFCSLCWEGLELFLEKTVRHFCPGHFYCFTIWCACLPAPWGPGIWLFSGQPPCVWLRV